MSDINEVLERLHRACIAGMDAEYVDDVIALLADHGRFQAMAEKLERFRSLARWVSNCAGHGVNSNQRRLGEELLVLIDAAKEVQP